MARPLALRAENKNYFATQAFPAFLACANSAKALCGLR